MSEQPDSPTGAAPRTPGPEDTRARILKAALRLFRQHGYHGVGIAQILLMAKAPKGSAYHHFPGGKQAIGVAVVQVLSESIINLIAAPGVMKSPKAVGQMGLALAGSIERTNHEICSLFGAFAAERAQAPLLAQAVAEGYKQMAAKLEQCLVADGFTKAMARERSQLVIMLLEGASMVSAAHRDIAPFRLAVRQAQALCKK
jgi:TetR/AcrR family transcriptional regulator, lmrAB and yxaGH operons repressor